MSRKIIKIVLDFYFWICNDTSNRKRTRGNDMGIQDIIDDEEFEENCKAEREWVDYMLDNVIPLSPYFFGEIDESLEYTV
jgi:hypothetical protein